MTATGLQLSGSQLLRLLLSSNYLFEIRSGPNWNHYLQIFLRVKFRLTRIEIVEADTTATRTPTNVKILVSDDGRSWEEAKHSGLYFS